MRHALKLATITAVLLVLASASLAQQKSGRGTVILPESSIERPGDLGLRAHTNTRMFIPGGGLPLSGPNPLTGPPFSGYFFETPASLGCVYFLVTTRVSGCNPNTAKLNPTGGAKAIAVVDAYDDTTAATDLAKFSTQFGLPAAKFTKVYATGTKPAMDPTGGWEAEESIDIEWTHAMAPSAHIYLVEAATNSFADLFVAVAKAASLVKAAGGGEVSMSWGGAEFSTETGEDSNFIESGVVFFASSGDSPGAIYPSASPNVVSVGGTTISRNPATGAFERETAWALEGNGPSVYEPIPTYQSSIAGKVGTKRGTPDVVVDGNPETGVWIYDSSSWDGVKGPWFIGAGTSLSAPLLAGIVNSADHFYTSTDNELTTVYSNLGISADFNDINYGVCGVYAGYIAANGWDFCSGVGSVHGKSGK